MHQTHLFAVIDQTLANVLNAGLLHKPAHAIIIHPCTKGAEEVNGLPWEGIHNLLDLLVTHIVVLQQRTQGCQDGHSM